MMTNIWYIIIMFILGTIIGSFFNVVGYRLPKGLSIVKPPSHCPHCDKQLTFIELIPILSYLIQRGKCRKCHRSISIIYPIIEFLTGLLFVISYLIWGLNFELLVSLIFVSIILVAVISDIRYMIISDEVLIFGGIALFIVRLYMNGDIISLLINAILPFIIAFLIKLGGDFIFKKESLGGGDIKLMILFGIVLGWPLALLSILFASFIALPIALIILKIKNTNIIPFGPFLGLAALLIYFFKLDISWLFNLIM